MAASTLVQAARAAVLLVVLADGSAHAWSSKDLLMFEPVHQLAIERVLERHLTAAQIRKLQDLQVLIDKDQRAVQSDEHAMTGIEKKGQDYARQRARYIERTDKLILGKLADAIALRQRGNMMAAMEPLAWMLHPLTDATSPKHEGFQPWTDDEGLIGAARHVFGEKSYPADDRRRRMLEGAVRWALDLFMGAPPPASFFDSDGMLQLPPDYRH